MSPARLLAVFACVTGAIACLATIDDSLLEAKDIGGDAAANDAASAGSSGSSGGTVPGTDGGGGGGDATAGPVDVDVDAAAPTPPAPNPGKTSCGATECDPAFANRFCCVCPPA